MRNHQRSRRFTRITPDRRWFQTRFHQSEYNKYYDDAVLGTEKIREFRPDIVYVHTHCMNLRQFPPVGASEAQFASTLAAELARFLSIWSARRVTRTRAFRKK